MDNSRDNRHHDFGSILDEWERSRPHPRPASASRSDASQSASRPDMAKWLETYPPEDKDRKSNSPSTGVRQPRPEKLKVEASLDLHGYHLDEAIVATETFINQSASDGLHKVVIIHGKGDNGQGVLRREIRTFLEHHPLTGAMGYSRGAEGGRGALWVVLRERSGATTE